MMQQPTKSRDDGQGSREIVMEARNMDRGQWVVGSMAGRRVEAAGTEVEEPGRRKQQQGWGADKEASMVETCD